MAIAVEGMVFPFGEQERPLKPFTFRIICIIGNLCGTIKNEEAGSV